MDAVADAVTQVRRRLTRQPHVGLVLGSGLGEVADALEDAVRIPYTELGWPSAGVAGHAGALVAGTWAGVEVAVLQGRYHLYEGWPLELVTRPVRLLAALEVPLLVVTNAAGGIRPDLEPGTLLRIADHLNLQFRGPWLDGRADLLGRRSLPDPYSPRLGAAADAVAASLGFALPAGVYAAVLGPSYETPAEIRMLARLGADAVGMSTVPEVVAARAAGMEVLGLSTITNRAAGLQAAPLSHAEVLEVGRRVRDRLVALLEGWLRRVAPPNLPSEV